MRSVHQLERLAGETAEQQAVRLQQLRAVQSERLATETAEDREARLQHDREHHRLHKEQ